MVLFGCGGVGGRIQKLLRGSKSYCTTYVVSIPDHNLENLVREK